MCNVDWELLVMRLATNIKQCILLTKKSHQWCWIYRAIDKALDTSQQSTVPKVTQLAFQLRAVPLGKQCVSSKRTSRNLGRTCKHDNVWMQLSAMLVEAGETVQMSWTNSCSSYTGLCKSKLICCQWFSCEFCMRSRSIIYVIWGTC